MAKSKKTQEQKAQERQAKIMDYEGKHIYFPSTKVTAKGGKVVDCKDVQTGYYTEEAIAINTDKYNFTIVTEGEDGSCWIDQYTKGKQTSASYERNNAYAKLLRGESKQVAIRALRGLPFAEVMKIVKASKDFKPCANEQALSWINVALTAQAERIKQAREQAKEQKKQRTKKEQPKMDKVA